MTSRSPARITLAHGSGGAATADLIRTLFLPRLQNPILLAADDGALLPIPRQGERPVFATDSHVVKPRFFPGGDIGKLAATGTLNDLAVMGARPRYMSAGFILEEGLLIEELERIVDSFASALSASAVELVAADTKVVERGACDAIFINTSGIGYLEIPFSGSKAIKSGDAILISGTLADHGVAIYQSREGIAIDSPLESDCAAIWPLVELAAQACGDQAASGALRIARDPTRGGLAAVLHEIFLSLGSGARLYESTLPIQAAVRGVCEMLGFDPLQLASEGRVVMVVDESYAQLIVDAWRSHPLGRTAAIIGEVSERRAAPVTLRTAFGGERVVPLPAGEILPRIC